MFPNENIYILPRSFDKFQFFARAKYYISFNISEDKHSGKYSLFPSDKYQHKLGLRVGELPSSFASVPCLVTNLVAKLQILFMVFHTDMALLVRPLVTGV